MTSEGRSLQVRRTARYFVAGEQRTPDEVWFLLHGYGQLARNFLASCASLQAPNRLLVAPEALARFYTRGFFEAPGASWMTREWREEEIRDYVAYLDAVSAEVLGALNHRPAVVAVLGFSQGAATASRWVAYGKSRADRLICWAGDVAHDIPDAATALGGVELVMVFGTRDDLLTEERRRTFELRMDQAGLRYRTVTFAGGHRMDGPTLAVLGRPAAD